MPTNILLQKYESDQQHNILQDGLKIEEQVQLSTHSWNISCLEFSPDGTQLATGSWDKTAHIWNLSSLDRPYKKLGVHEDGHKSPLTCLTWLPQIDCLLCTASSDSSLILWHTGSGDPIARLQEHSSWVLGVSCTSDGKRLASSCWDGSVILWDIDSLRPLCKLIGHSNGVWACCFSPTNNSILCTASEDRSLRIWDMRADDTWHSDMVLSGIHTNAIKTCCWSPCGNYLAAGSKDCKISIWDIRGNKAINCLTGHNAGVSDVSYLPTSSSILFSVGDMQCCVWDVFNPQGECLGSLQQHVWSYEVEALAISPDGSLLSTAGVDRSTIISTINITDSEMVISPADLSGLPYAQIPVRTDSTFIDKKLSAHILDLAIAENESREKIESEQTAKQTIRVKCPVTSEILQNKLSNLKTVGSNQKQSMDLSELFKTSRTERQDGNQKKSKELVEKGVSSNSKKCNSTDVAPHMAMMNELQTKVLEVNKAKNEEKYEE